MYTEWNEELAIGSVCLFVDAPLCAYKTTYMHTGVYRRFGVAVTRWSRSTQLLYIEPGEYWDG